MGEGDAEAALAARLCAHVAERYNDGAAVGPGQSLFYSGLVDSLGIAELAALASAETGRPFAGTDIVERDLDTAALIAAAVLGHA